MVSWPNHEVNMALGVGHWETISKEVKRGETSSGFFFLPLRTVNPDEKRGVKNQEKKETVWSTGFTRFGGKCQGGSRERKCSVVN